MLDTSISPLFPLFFYTVAHEVRLFSNVYLNCRLPKPSIWTNIHSTKENYFLISPVKGWLVVFGFNATLTAVVDGAYVFPGFPTPVLTQLFFPKPPTTFLTCFCRGERRKYAGKKSRLNRGSNSTGITTTRS